VKKPAGLLVVVLRSASDSNTIVAARTKTFQTIF